MIIISIFIDFWFNKVFKVFDKCLYSLQYIIIEKSHEELSQLLSLVILLFNNIEL